MEIKFGVQDAVVVAKFCAECDGYAAGVRTGMEIAKSMFIKHMQQHPSDAPAPVPEQRVNGHAQQNQE